MDDTERTVLWLTKYRRDRRAAGLCAYPGCALRSDDLFHCPEHAAMSAAWQRDYRARIKAAAARMAELERRVMNG